jgi:hypothetical protein
MPKQSRGPRQALIGGEGAVVVGLGVVLLSRVGQGQAGEGLFSWS